MKKNKQQYNFTLILLLFFISCTPEPDQKLGEFFIYNKSSYNIELQLFQSGILKINYILDSADFVMETRSSCRGCTPFPPPFWGDSLVITFNETTKLIHYGIEGQDSIRNFFYRESWVGGETQSGTYRFEYIITDADYEEALNRQMN